MDTHQLDWTVLLIGGPSGVGKSTVAQRIGQRFGVSWLHVDDLRLALQESRVSLPMTEETAALYFFEETPDVLSLPAERLCEGLIAVGEVLSAAVEKVVTNHVALSEPVVIEGDAVLPSLSARPALRAYATGGRVRALFLVEPEETEMLANLVARGRGIASRSAADLRTQARMYWLFGDWLATEARRHSLPVLTPRPWDTLVDRVVATLDRATFA